MVAYDAYMENTKQLTETEAAVNYISMRMNEGDTSYWPGTEIRGIIYVSTKIILDLVFVLSYY